MNGGADMDALLRADAESRRRALGPGSYLVEAPAGAGKTELLAQRFLKLLAEVEHPEEIVALTFTKKAAAEMRQRIMDTLAAAAAGRVPERAHKRESYELARVALENAARRGWALLEHAGRLRVTTIDALCAGLVRQMPVLSRFGGEPAIVEDAAPHYREAARRALAWLEEEGEHARAVERALKHLDNDAERLAELLAAMLERRDQWLRHALETQPWEDAERAFRRLVCAGLERAARAIPAELQWRLMPLARFAAGNLPDDHALAALTDWSRPLRPEAEELPLWRALAALLLTNENGPRKQLNVKNGFPAGKADADKKEALLSIIAGLPEEAFAALAAARRLPEPSYSPEETATIEALSRLLRLAAAELWNVFNESGEADFVEVALRARAALGDETQPTDLALALDYRIRHLLIDEFQDTSPTQVELLERLTAGWSPGDGRTLFLVGDPMQSIYRFRKADVGLFLDVRGRGLGGLPVEPLVLYRNNRSRRAVVEWLNGAFARIFAGADDIASGAIAHRPSATEDTGSGGGVSGHPAVVAPDGDAAAAEVREILTIIDAERAEDPGRKIAVLVRAKRHLAPLIGELRRSRPELRFTAVEMTALSDRQPVQDLLSLTRALLHRADRVAWLACLRAPWCGLTLADLHALAGDDHVSTVWQLIHDPGRLGRLTEDGRTRLSHFSEAMAEALAHRGRMPARRWVEGTWLLLGGPACLRDRTDLADATAFLDLVDELEACGRLVPDELERKTGERHAAPDAEADGRLQFMTIHKAKGLEFDTVILPGLNHRPRNGEPPLLRWEEVLVDQREHLLVAPVKRRRDRDAETLYDWLGSLERTRERNEAARVLYVGATRARRRLHWVAAVKLNKDGEAKPEAGSLLELLWPVVGEEFARASPADAEGLRGGPGFDFVPRLLRLAEMPSLPRAVPVEPQLPPPAGSAGPETADPLDALIGTLAHRYLEMIARDGPEAWPEARIGRLRAAMENWLSRQGCGDRDAAQGAERVVGMLSTTLASAEGRWVLAPREGAAAELALVKLSRGDTPTSVVDRTFVEDGVRWIIDYKTARPEGDPGAHAEHYREQLERYAGLYADDGLPVRCAVFYVALGRLVELSPPPSA